MRAHQQEETSSDRVVRTHPREEPTNKIPSRSGRCNSNVNGLRNNGQDTNRVVAGILPLLLSNPRRPNKASGKDLKLHYRSTLMAGLVLSLGVMTLLMRADLRVNEDERVFELSQQEVVQMEEIEQTKQEMKAPPPPRPPVPIEVPDDVEFEDVLLDLDATLDLDAQVFDLPPPPAAPAEEYFEEELEIFVVVEQMPQIIGGSQKVYEYLSYPEIARQAGIEGMAVIQIVVSPDGLPLDPVIAKTAGEVLDEAAVKAVMQLTFTPGRQRGKAVAVRLAIPIRFRIRDAQR